MINKKGMTLIELLVYMVLAALVLAPIIMLVQNSSVNMARDAGRVNLQMSGREILQIIYDDLKNTGFKLSPDIYGDVNVDTSAANFYLGDYELKDTKTNKTYKMGYTKLGSPCNGFESCTSIVDPSKIFKKFYDMKKPSGSEIINLGTDGYGCRAQNSCEFIRDSASFFSGNYYLFTAPRFASDTAVMIDGGGKAVFSWPGLTAWPAYSGNLTIENIKCYDTIGVRMLKLDKDGNVDGASAYEISYKVRDTTKLMLVREIRTPHSNTPEYSVLARNVAALKFRYSDNMKDWYDYIKKTEKEHILMRRSIQYIKVILVLRDPKKLSATNPAPPITLRAAGDGVTGYTKAVSGPTPALILTPTDRSLYERYEIVIPIPNNGLFP